jgi:hypothetical protein
MTPVFDPQTDVCADWREAFPEPRTLPGGWDLADVLASDRAAMPTRSNGSRAIRTSNKANLPTVSFFDRLARQARQTQSP